VEFSVVTTESGDHKFQAGDVRGVKGGKLFCETRHEHRASHDAGGASAAAAGAGTEKSERGRPQVRGRGQGYVGGRGGRVVSDTRGGGRVDRGGRGGSEWMLVRRDRNENYNSRGSGSARGHGRGEEYSERPSRLDRNSSSQSQHVAPSPTPASTSAPAKQEVDSVGDVPATPRTVSKKTPRQSKPSA